MTAEIGIDGIVIKANTPKAIKFLLDRITYLESIIINSNEIGDKTKREIFGLETRGICENCDIMNPSCNNCLGV